MKDGERARIMVALAAVELNLSECCQVEGWWNSLSPGRRHEWLEFQADVRAYQHDVQNVVVVPPRGEP